MFILLGDLNIDTLISIPHYPPAGGDAFPNRVEVRVGGGGANSAAALARLGQPVALLAVAGNDAWAGMALEPLRAAGVRTNFIQQRKDLTTGLVFIPVTPDGDRTMFSYRGANAALSPEQIKREMLTQAGWLHVSGYALMDDPQRMAVMHAVRLAREMDLPASLDLCLPALQKRPADVFDLLPLLNTLVLGVDEAVQMTGENDMQTAALALLKRGPRMVAVKLGSQGCVLAEQVDEKVQTGIYPILPVQVVDTTGAGDAFCAGLIAARRAGLGMHACAALASALGGLTASVYGGGLNLPPRAEVLTWLRDRIQQVDAAFSGGLGLAVAWLSDAGGQEGS